MTDKKRPSILDFARPAKQAKLEVDCQEIVVNNQAENNQVMICNSIAFILKY